MKPQLSPEEKLQLLKIAKEAIDDSVQGCNRNLDNIPPGPLSEPFGCFVTIKQQGRLRGCIGCFSAETPLAQTVREMARAAACRDPRFYPVSTEELPELAVEISVLSPLEKISAIEEILPGTHGLYIEKKMFRGVLLPQVAVEYGWDRETFLQQTCLKAGLEQDAWKNEADIYIFTAEIFGE